MNKNTLKKIAIVTLLILVVSSAFVVVKQIMDKESTATDKTSNVPNEAQTTSNEPTASPNFTDGTPRDPGNTLNENQGSAVVKDTGGQDSRNDHNKTPLTSSSGKIKLYSPQNNDSIEEEVVVAGESTLSTVHYRIVDSLTGVISSGILEVNNGKFSATIEVETGAQKGTIEFFGKRQDLTEFDNIEVEVLFR